MRSCSLTGKRVDDSDKLTCCRLDKVDEANSIGGLGPVATFQGPLVNPKLGLLPSHPSGTDTHSQLPPVIPELDSMDDTPLHTPRSANSVSSMKSAFSTMHPTSLSGGQGGLQSRRTTAGGEAMNEFEDILDVDDLELGTSGNDREDASLLRSNVSRHSTYDSSGDPLTQHGGELEGESAWSNVLQNPTVQRFSQATKSWGSKLRGKYAEY